jgi:hypothetical protein
MLDVERGCEQGSNTKGTQDVDVGPFLRAGFFGLRNNISNRDTGGDV